MHARQDTLGADDQQSKRTLCLVFGCVLLPSPYTTKGVSGLPRFLFILGGGFGRASGTAAVFDLLSRRPKRLILSARAMIRECSRHSSEVSRCFAAMGRKRSKQELASKLAKLSPPARSS